MRKRKERIIGPTDFKAMLDSIYRHGGSPDIVYMTLESAHDRGLIGCWEYQWRRLLRWLRSGIWSPRGFYGGQSARPAPGTISATIGRRTRTPSGTSSTTLGEPSTTSSHTPQSHSGYGSQSTDHT